MAEQVVDIHSRQAGATFERDSTTATFGGLIPPAYELADKRPRTA